MWAVGTLFTLVTIALLVALLVVNLDAVKWENLSRERIVQVALFIGIAVALTTLIVLLAIGGASLGWTGFGDKTFWDWLQLLSALAIPVVLAAAGLWFAAQQDARQQRIENQRAESEQEVEEQRTQDAALQAYLDQMSSLMIGQNSLRNSEEDSEVRTLARARTLTVLGRLDPKHKTAVMPFLVEAKLVQSVDERPPIVGLSGAHLSGADLSGADLIGANLSDANLANANLENANLENANLEGADVTGASMKGASIDHANMHNLFAFNVNLSGAHLWDTNLRGPNTYLDGANLKHANLASANLRGAELDSANLRGASHVTQEQLDSCKSLLDATMPNGQKYEVWLKGKDYVTDEFEPAFRLEFGEEGWAWKVSRETADEVHMRYVPDFWGELVFARPLHVFDPSNLRERKEVPAPETVHEWVSWFQSHPTLETSNPVPVQVGGVSGMRIDVTCVPWPRDRYRELPLPCSPPFPTNEEVFGFATLGAERKDRYIIVDVRGETVLIDVATETEEGKFDEFLPIAQKVLDTVKWETP